MMKVDGGKPATCTETGLTAKSVCQRDGCSYMVGGEEIPALGHDLQEVADTAKAATCTEKGKEADKKCSRCEYTETGADIDALGHNLVGDITETQAPTCTAVGKGTQHCDRCNTEVEVEIPMIAHVDANEDGKCDVCNGDMPADEPGV